MITLEEYPSNLLNSIKINDYVDERINIAKPTEDLSKHLEQALEAFLTNDEQIIIDMYYRKHMKPVDIAAHGVHMDGTPIEVSEINEAIDTALDKLREPKAIEHITRMEYSYQWSYQYKNPCPGLKTWPAGFLWALGLNDIYFEEIDYNNPTQDQLDGLEYVVKQLPEDEQNIINLHYKHGMTYKDIAAQYKPHTGEWVRKNIDSACRKLRAPDYRIFIIDGKNGALNQFDGTDNLVPEQYIYLKSVTAIGLSTRASNFLLGVRANTVQKAIKYCSSPRWWLSKGHFKKCGPKTGLEIMKKFESLELVDRSNPGWDGIAYWVNADMINEVNSKLDEILAEYDNLTSDTLVALRNHLNHRIKEMREEEVSN